jgi:hypothetical protein
LGAAGPSNILEIWGETNLRVAAGDEDGGDGVSWVGAKWSSVRVTAEFVDAGSKGLVARLLWDGIEVGADGELNPIVEEGVTSISWTCRRARRMALMELGLVATMWEMAEISAWVKSDDLATLWPSRGTGRGEE